MKQPDFDIKVIDTHWVKENEPDDGLDLCAHGHVLVRIGDEVLSDYKSGSWTISVTALYLLRTLKISYYPNDFCSQLLPCCGHFIIASDGKPVEIYGCPTGVDWTIEHMQNSIKFTSAKGSVAFTSKEEYKSVVFNFVSQVEQFYKNSLPRIVPENGLDDVGYYAFWKEFNYLKTSNL